jgi:diguanylate cyclase (GGDEF)-like protein/PAS domain S-box-containing protein
MHKRKHKILFVNDSSENAHLIQERLKEEGDVFELVYIQGFDQSLERLSNNEFDVFLLDLGHKNGQGVDILNMIRKHVMNIPTVVLTSAQNESLDVRALQLGALDYLIKDRTDVDALVSLLRHAAECGKTKKALLESEARYRLLLESVTDYVYTVQIENGHPVATSHGPGCVAVTGYTSDEYTANPFLWYLMIHEEDRQAVIEQAEDVLSQKNTYPLEHRIIHKDGRVRWIKNTPVPHIDQQGRLLAYDGLVSDITDLKQAEQKLSHSTYYDALTNLPNRELFSDRLRQAIIHARRHKRMFAVMFLGLDRFKGINDTLGHKAGDLLLRHVSERLANSIREGDTVARLGADEFIILFPDLIQTRDASFVAQKIHSVLSKGFLLDGQELFITTSIGISFYSADGTDVDTLIKNAGVAMYQAKAQGRNTYKFYTPAMNNKCVSRFMLENNLRKALERKEFVLYYQPLVELSSGRITGVEALVRWRHPILGLLSPLEFIPMAEDTGLIIPIGEWIMENVCMQGRKWNEAGFSPLRMTVNLSMRQFTHNAVIKTVFNALEKSYLDPCHLELELTESMVMQNAEQTIATLHELKSAGIQISLDDFGTGYSSLSYLKNFPLNNLKLDRSFVSDIAKETKNESISKAVIDLAHSLSLKVIAEGVETFDQLELLRSWNCDEVQGFLFSRPLPVEEVTRLMTDMKTKYCG